MSNNEAAEALERAIREHAEPETDAELILLTEALATERRNTVERIRERLDHYDYWATDNRGEDFPVYIELAIDDIRAILDEIGAER